MISKKEGQQQAKKFLCKLFNNTCSVCDKEYPYYVFDFHHVLGEKKFGIAKYIQRKLSTRFRITQELMDEVEKCVLVCANCHREIHYAEKIDE